MRIDNHSSNLAQPVSQPSTPDAASKTGGAGSKPQAAADSVNISEMAAQLSADPQKLAQLAAAYESGTYSVSPGQIAASMIDHMLAG